MTQQLKKTYTERIDFNNGVTYNYITQNGQVVRQTWTENGTSHVMDFIYDTNGRPYAMVYDGNLYYYLLDQRGDVVIITDENGLTAARYGYDAWGNVIYAVGSMTEINPLRYRGYYYDAESGLYYLGSRYYDPVVKRFINSDTSNLITANPYGLTDKNLFAYCDNNPVMRKDDGGEFWNVVVGAVIGAGINAVITGIDTYEKGDGVDWDAVVHSAVSGAISGGVAASGVGIVGQRVVAAATSAMDTIYSGIRDVRSGKTTVGKVVIKTALSAGIGALTAGAGMNSSKMRGLRASAQSARRTLGKSGMHPTVKRAASRAVNRFNTYARKQYLESAKSTAMYGLFSWGTGKVVDYAY